DHTSADELGSAQAVIRVGDGRFDEHGLRRRVHLRGNKRDAAGGERCARLIYDLDGQIHLQLRRFFDRNINVGFEAAGTVDGSERGGSDHAIANPDGNISDNAGARCDDLVVMQLDLLLAHLGIERVQLRLGSVEGGARLVEILLADYAGTGKAADAVVILLRPCDLRDLGGAGVLLAVDRGLLLGGIDLHHGSAGGNAFAGVDKDLRDDAFDLRHDYSRVAGFQGGDVVGGVVDFLDLRSLDLHRHGLRGVGFGFFALAAGGREKERGEKGAGQNPGQNQRWLSYGESRHNIGLSEAACCGDSDLSNLKTINGFLVTAGGSGEFSVLLNC